MLPLPFLASHVTFDEEVRDLAPAIDVVAFDVPAGTELGHRVTVLALDGTRVAAYVREEDGVARPDAEGYVFVGTVSAAARDAGVGPGRPLGRIRDGFTKLR